jgi:hypothetical protein
MSFKLIAILGATTTTAFAAPPEVTALSPSGGQRGTEVRVQFIGKADAANVQVWSDRPGIEFVSPDGKDAVKLKIAADAPLGTAWLRFHNAEGASSLRPFVIGAAPEMPETEPNDDLPRANAPAQLPVTINGVLQKSGEVDAFRIALKKGETLMAVVAARQSLGSPMDGVLQISDAAGFVLEQNNDRHGFDPQVALAAPQDGDYFVRVFAFPADPNTSIQFSGAPTYVYRLTLTSGPLMDHVMPCAVLSNQPASVRPFGFHLPPDPGELSLPPMPNGVHPVFQAGWESTAKVLFTPSPPVIEQEPNPLAQPQPAMIPGVLCGVVGEPKDVDAWKFSAKAGQRFALRLTAKELDSALDAVVRIYDSAGQKLAEVDDAPQDEADAVLDFAAPKDGDYLVAITDRFAHGGRDYWYALTVAEPQASAVLSAAADHFTIKAETPLEIPVTIERRQGYALPIKIAVEGLPDGITAEAVASEPSGDSSKMVKLAVKSTRMEPWSGPIRIVGRAEGDAIAERTAECKSPATGELLPRFWLTALPK